MKKRTITYECYKTQLGKTHLELYFYFDYEGRLIRSSFGKDKKYSNITHHPYPQFIKAFESYLKGKAKKPFNYSLLQIEGTPFQKAVWKELLRIPYGKTRSYGDIAKNIGSPQAYRAVGTAIGKNPFAVIFPCHRVLHSGRKKIGKFGGGEPLKKALLENEGVFLSE